MSGTNADFLFTAVCKPGASPEVVRRFYPVLRQWAEVKKAYKGRVFTKDEVEEAIVKCESAITGAASTSSASASAAAGTSQSCGSTAIPATTSGRLFEGWWPRWALDAKNGVEVLVPKGKDREAAWVHATPIGIGHHGQKRRYLFVQTPKIEMDCLRRSVRLPGGGPTAEEALSALVACGEDPVHHSGWTDGTDVDKADPTKPKHNFITPGVPPAADVASAGDLPATVKNEEFHEELTGDFERMALLRRSNLVKTRTCDHPDPLSEPRAAAGIHLPALTEKDILGIPAEVAEQHLSSLQLETVCFAARRFRTALPDGRTAGYVLGDGTGCGKGRVIGALIYHLWNMGHRRSIWVSATSDLYYDACRDLQDLGADIPCVNMRRLPPSGPLDQKGSEAHKELVRHLGAQCDGIIFLTYSLLVQTGQRRQVLAAPVRTEECRQQLLKEGLLNPGTLRCVRSATFGDDHGTVELQVGDKVVGHKSLSELEEMEVPFTVSFVRILGRNAFGSEEGGAEYTVWNSRLGQLVNWMGGASATGLICFDEVHKAKNLFPDKEEVCSSKAGIFVDHLQETCRKAPVLYVSATAATEVQHLGYMSRLGVWGPGTAYENFQAFARAIDDNGVAAMEMFAINMKAIGALSCRALAYVGTEFDVQQCSLTKDQREVYNAAANFWIKLVRKYQLFTQSPDLQEAYRKHFKLKQKKIVSMDTEEDKELGKKLWQHFWSAQQRFFKAMCTSFKVPDACQAASEAVERGEQVVLSIWATGESRSAARMAQLREEVAGRVLVDKVSEGGIFRVRVEEKRELEELANSFYQNMRLKSEVTIGGVVLPKMSCLHEVHGRRIVRPADLAGAVLPAPLLFRQPATRNFAVAGTMSGTSEKVLFEMSDDAYGEHVIVAKVLDGPEVFRRAELECWRLKTVNGRAVGKANAIQLQKRLRKGTSLAFQDPVIAEHLSGPEMILEHFLKNGLLTEGAEGQAVAWAKEQKAALFSEMRSLALPANAMDAIVENLGGLRKVAELSGRSHRMKRRKDGSLAYVARCEELKCSQGGANLVEQTLFQKGSKPVCIVTEVASAGISLHSDRRHQRQDFQPPRRTMISVELPWGADKAIQCFGRVHRANQIVPPRFLMLCTPLGGEVRFTSSIARRMKLLGAVTKGDRMTSMGGGADKRLAEFDVNNEYGVRALVSLFEDTTSSQPRPELSALYESLSFIGESSSEATCRWPKWADFAQEAANAWHATKLEAEFFEMTTRYNAFLAKGKVMGRTRESDHISRFLNRILMLDVDLQNALFEAFFAVYTELVRVDTANGDYDVGVENLNQSQGRMIQQIEVAARDVWYRDPASGAETQYVKLQLDQGIPWEVAKGAYDALPAPGERSIEGFYRYRRRPEAEPIFLLIRERQQVGGDGGTGAATQISSRAWRARQRRKQYIVWHPCGVSMEEDGGKTLYSAEEFTHDSRFELTEGTDAELEAVQRGWVEAYHKAAKARLTSEHILTGDILTAWRLAASSNTGGSEGALEREGKESKLQIVRAITQPDGVPVVGVRVDPQDLGNLKYVLSCQQLAAEKEYSTSQAAKKIASEGQAAPERLDIRFVALTAAETFLRHLATVEDGSVPFTSWIDVHRILSESNSVPRSVDGLRGTQLAVNSLVRTRLLIASQGKVTLGIAKDVEKLPTAEDLKTLFFRDSAAADDESDNEGSSSAGEDAADEDGEEGGHWSQSVVPYTGATTGAAVQSRASGEAGKSTSESAPVQQAKKRKSNGAESVATPQKARCSGAAVDPAEPKSKARKDAQRQPARKSKAAGKDSCVSKEVTFEELFDMDSAEAEDHEIEKAAARRAPDTERASMSPKRKRNMMAAELFGESSSDENSTGP